MGAVNPTLPASTARCVRSHDFRRRPLAGFLVLAASLVSSSCASAGIREYATENGKPSRETGLSESGPVSGPLFGAGTLPPLVSDSNHLYFSPVQVSSGGNAQFSASLFLINGPTAAAPSTVRQTVVPTTNNDRNSQLLIPLPTGVSAGAAGLIGLALLLASKRVRRGILA